MAAGDPDEIKKRVPGRRVRCRTRLPAATVESWPWVQRVRGEGERLDICCTDAEDLCRRLLERDRALEDLEVSGAGLEEAFLDLTTPAGERVA